MYFFPSWHSADDKVYAVCLIGIFNLLANLDRSNIGNAHITTMPADIGLMDNQFGIAVTLYYATFIPAEPCTAILIKTVGVGNLLTFCGAAWGVTTLCMGFIQNVSGLYLCRLLIGLFEAGVAPCYDIYISSIYKKNERGKRIALIFGFASVANAIGGLMATSYLHYI